MKEEYRREFERKGVEQVKEELPYMSPRQKKYAAKQWLAEKEDEGAGASWLDENEDAW